MILEGQSLTFPEIRSFVHTNGFDEITGSKRLKVAVKTGILGEAEYLNHPAMKDLAPLVPLMQTILWILFSLGVIFFLRKEIRLVLSIIRDRLTSGSEFKIGPVEIGELKKKIGDMEQEVSMMDDKVSQLFLLTMAHPMYKNLKKIDSGKFGDYKMEKGLERELYHLRDIGYIDIPSIKAIPQEGSNLSDYVKITEAGKSFVQLREEYVRNTMKADSERLNSPSI